ncbi:MAG: sarcosine oxidase subunit delta [Rhodocyclaceae bacterium]|jgi:sarcosine oxidase subunit delta|nr:sarcosine oxidase subunit delta [Rhodocyclaceae bacterium]MCA3024428.1 sarcosine oxidase subunit delta [Rhodocyclaceae bacterium]MCA3030569.1 sarcosine oxidase subunit delta [Rhodocyclaceae bacterium]MCA3036820.1 sarcosine oxidase subunit delta [Rhodocyclaceae bacterium]MCA3039676.1 sarcosine oxidase subunit delta [Rhodocyclaceae bacterium]
MMELQCPWCGRRPENEFHCGGTTAIVRPLIDCSDEVWGNYLFFRENPKGLHAERWRHTFGCGQWFNIVRDTVTHEVSAVYGITEAQPRAVDP